MIDDTQNNPPVDAPKPSVEKLTDREMIAKHYKGAMDSVRLINGPKPEHFSEDEWTDVVKKNKKHIKIMLAQSFWTDEDLTPLKEALE